MKATVRLINPRRGMYAAEIEGGGEFVIFELLDSSEPEIGNVISHPDFHTSPHEAQWNAGVPAAYSRFPDSTVFHPALVNRGIAGIMSHRRCSTHVDLLRPMRVVSILQDFPKITIPSKLP